MPLCTLHLVSLDGGPTRTRSFLSSLIAALPKTENDPVLLLAGTPQRWVIVPSRDSAGISDLRSTDWHAVVLLKGEQGLPAQTRTHVKEEWTVIVGVPSRVVSGFAARNADFLRPKTDPIPLTGSLDRPRLSESQQGLEATPELIEWAKGYDEERKGTRGEETRAVSMLNLLKFKAGKKGTYQEYGKAFGESIGSKRGGVAKVVGAVTTPKDGDWGGSLPAPPLRCGLNGVACRGDCHSALPDGGALRRHGSVGGLPARQPRAPAAEPRGHVHPLPQGG